MTFIQKSNIFLGIKKTDKISDFDRYEENNYEN